jgi:hypothetical protein
MFNLITFENNNKKTEKTFEIVDFPTVNKSFGDYKAPTMKTAANKAFSFLSNIVGEEIDEEGTFIVFILRDKKTHNTQKYIGTRIRLENNVRNGNDVVRYKNVISKYHPDLDKI